MEYNKTTSTPQVISTVISRIIIAVDGFADGEINGRFCSAHDGNLLHFHGMWQMIHMAEEIFEKHQYPQASHEHRSFTKQKKSVMPTEGAGENIMSAAMESQISGEKATFIVQVQFRQNATWQGTIKWAEGKKQQHFRSTLEMIKLMDEVISCSMDDEEMYPSNNTELE